MIEVTWKQSASNFHKADAQKCYEEMGETDVTPEKVLEIARDENTELHKCFEWDDGKAAEKYRLSQARQIISFLIVKDDNAEEDDIPIRVFQISREKNTYQPIRTFVENQDEYKALLKRAMTELVNIRNRYKQLKELEDVFAAIDSL
jgi:hypothetical protein